MQRLVRREKGAPVVQEGEDDGAEDAEAEGEPPLELELAEVKLQGPPKASLPVAKPSLSLDGTPAKFRSSSRYVNLHSYDPQTQQATGFAETKIGGHQLDHKRSFYADWQGLHGPLKTAVWGAVGALGAAISGSSSSPSVSSQSAQARTSLAYAAPKPEVLVYSAVKIGGHPLDHVPFPSRGLPSRPLLGFVPRAQRLPPPTVFQAPGMSTSAVTYEIAPNVSNLYDCTVEAVVFTNYILRMEPFSARTVTELEAQQENSENATSTSLSGAWRQGGVLAALSFIAGRFVPTSRKLTSSRRKKRSASEDARRLVVEVLPDEADELLMDGVAGLSKEAAKAEITIEKGADRWAKRVQGLESPSKLLKFKFVRTLGVGNFAEVMLVENRVGKLTVLKESDKLPEAANEINILSRVHSPHVVEIIQYFIEEIGHRHFAYIEMEFCDNGDLRQLLEAKGRLKDSTFDSMFHQLCQGLTEIHRHGIVHRDLKPGNVLLTSDGATKIADFGVSTYLESDLLTHHAAGTLAFMAPEVRRYFLGEAVSYDAKADIWSLGALAVAMLTGNPEPRVATRPVDELVEELREEKLDEKYLQLVEGMLATRPDDRPSLDELLKSFPAMNARL
ncbi:hypothetical protein PHYBOEH_004019 [Phytophthora boehmeriae]|uniref:Protein kinase domain-containing protein n=1 Tax=Phytophthora boehmeriae TaxID=109152 RepID=A0A8T1WP85_9STRA|nr:hypothetical protein PHYBOEH_004019 [Phytophthora boehmeriae]